MHNCKVTRKRLIELAMEKTPSDQSESGPAELEGCPACLEEFASIGKLLRVADQAMDSARPFESFWSGYHARLRQSLERDSTPGSRSQNKSGTLVGVRNLFTSYVRVPVPAAAVLVVLFGLSVVFAVQSRRSSTGPGSGTATVVTKTVEMPVIRERLVTRVVYRERSQHLPQDRTTQKQSVAKAIDRRNAVIENSPASLAGFKPANEAKLTIIKGSYRDDK